MNKQVWKFIFLIFIFCNGCAASKKPTTPAKIAPAQGPSAASEGVIGTVFSEKLVGEKPAGTALPELKTSQPAVGSLAGQPAGPIQKTTPGTGGSGESFETANLNESPAEKSSEEAEGIKRDPFTSPILDKLNLKKLGGGAAEAVDVTKVLKFQGVWGNGQRFAIINDEILKEGDKVYNYVVKQIFFDRVIVSDGSREVTLYLEDETEEGK